MRGIFFVVALMLAGPVWADELEMGSDLGSGTASYFSREIAGNRTASGEPCDPDTLTAAHRTAPFGSRLRVTNLATGQSVIVRINDRGPFRAGRVIDLSHAAAREIGMHRTGTAKVSLAMLAD
ncbi:MAG: septal ring lytic transglycosylase RlpA family lipoprotein [Alphaproteobacteria bacterium HGW-Alphaproteobacteria-16]|nr:MAG: septal ring lytic transglycosylase RlpA family lipoprotein [Alphaproteobacteria bacterium HGW-Alphaproteobacteria-16]